MFQASNFFAPVPDSGNSRDFSDSARLRALSDLSLAGQVAGAKFFELFPGCVGCPDAVTETFVSLGLLPKEIRDVDGKNSRPLFPARGLESALSTGKVRPGVLPADADLSPELRRPSVTWKGLTLDYSCALFWVRSYNAARKQAKACEPKDKDSGNSPEPKKPSKHEREAELRASVAEARLREAQERGLREQEEAFKFRNKLVAEIIKLRSQAMPLPTLEQEFKQTMLQICNMLDIPV